MTVSKTKIFFYFIVSFLTMILILITPLVTMQLIDKGILMGNWNNVLVYFFLLLLLLILIDFSNTYKYYLENQIELEDGISLREKLHSKVRRLKNLNNIDTALSIYTTDIDVMREKNVTIVSLFISINKMLFVICIIYFIDVKIVLLTIILMITLPIIPYILSKYLPRVSNHILESKSDFINYTSNSLKHSKEIRLGLLEQLDYKKLVKYLDLTKRPILKFYKLNSLAILNNLIYTVIFCLAILICIREIFKGNLTIGSLTALMSYLALASAPIQEIMGHYNHLRVIGGSSLRYKELLSRKEVLSLSHDKYSSTPNSKPLLEISNLKKGDLDININLVVEKGEWVLIKGDSGKGKTTMLNIISMLDYDYEGDIVLKGKPLNQYTTENLYKSLIYIMQSHKIMDDHPSHEMLLTINNLDKFKYHLKILNVLYLFQKNILFHQMSGGEKQRFLLALALEKQPEILILDEPTAALDYENSNNLINHLVTVRGDKTTIIVSHDKTFEFIDKKLVL